MLCALQHLHCGSVYVCIHWKHSAWLLAAAGTVVSAYPQTYFNEDAQAIVTGECQLADSSLWCTSSAAILCCGTIRALFGCLLPHSMACTAVSTVLQRPHALVCTLCENRSWQPLNPLHGCLQRWPSP